MSFKKEGRTGKRDFLRKVAKRAQFSYGDVHIIWDTIDDLIKEEVADGHEICMDGLFTIKTTKTENWNAWDNFSKTHVFVPESYRIIISPSETLLDVLRSVDNKKTNN